MGEPADSLIQFYDETGLNVLPAGINVSVYNVDGSGDPTTLVGQAFTIFGGTANIKVENAANYQAQFIGTQAPAQAQNFSGGASDPTVVTVLDYRSPVISAQGYADLACEDQPNGWYALSELQRGGVLHALMRGIMGGQALVDSEMQQVQGALRLQSCTGSLIDSWAADFLGSYLPRYFQESDASYYGRIVAALSLPKLTLAALQSVAQAFYTAIALETGAEQSENLTFDDLGGYDSSGGFDVSQGFVANIPTVYVWDYQSRPDLAALYGILQNDPTYGTGWFVIQIAWQPQNTLAWFLDYSHLDYESFLLAVGSYQLTLVAPDPRLAALINFVKAGGAEPIYASAITSD